MRYSVHGFIAAGFLFLSPLPATAAPCTLAGLHWLKGAWAEDGNDTKGEERWTIAPDGRLMGSSWFLERARGGGLAEAMTIHAESGRIFLTIRHFDIALAHAQEAADAPMQFVARRCEKNAVTLDGEGAQAGEHMTYRRDGDRLAFTGDFLHQGKPVRDEESFTRTGD